MQSAVLLFVKSACVKLPVHLWRRITQNGLAVWGVNFVFMEGFLRMPFYFLLSSRRAIGVQEWGEQHYGCMAYFLAAWCWGKSMGEMRKTVFVIVIKTVHGEVQIRASPLWHLQCILFFSFLWLPEFQPQFQQLLRSLWLTLLSKIVWTISGALLVEEGKFIEDVLSLDSYGRSCFNGQHDRYPIEI